MNKHRFTRSSQNFRPASNSYIVKDFYLTTALNITKTASNFKISKNPKMKNQKFRIENSDENSSDKRKDIFLKQLDLEQREFFSDKKNCFKEILNKFDRKFKEACHLSDQVKHYRYKLGHMMENSLNGIFDVMKSAIEQVYKTIQDKENMKNTSLKEYERKFINFNNMYNLLKGEHNCIHQLVKVKDSEYKMLESEFSSLKSKNKYLEEVIKNSDIMNGALEWQPDGELNKIKFFEKNYKERVKFYEKAEIELTKERERFKNWFAAYQKEEDNKTKILRKMDDLLKAMLKSQKHDKGCQVTEAGLIWNPEDLVNPKVVDKINIGASEIYLASQFKSNSNYLQMATSGIGNDILTGEFRLNDSDKDLYANRALERINELGNATYAEKLKVGAFKANKREKMIWRLPYVMKLFLANSLKKRQSIKVRPWIYLREDISNLFNYFSKNYGFLNGGNIGKPTSLEEMTCMYFLEVSNYDS